ncbi:MAG: hypothetical protein AAFO07_01680 [Bacteroidota bacterium]
MNTMPQTRQELAELYQVNVATLKRWLKDKKVDLPNRRRLTPSEVKMIFSVLGKPTNSN